MLKVFKFEMWSNSLIKRGRYRNGFQQQPRRRTFYLYWYIFNVNTSFLRLLLIHCWMQHHFFRCLTLHFSTAWNRMHLLFFVVCTGPTSLIHLCLYASQMYLIHQIGHINYCLFAYFYCFIKWNLPLVCQEMLSWRERGCLISIV